MLRTKIVNSFDDDSIVATTSLSSLINWNGETADELCCQKIVREIFETYNVTRSIVKTGCCGKSFVMYIYFNDLSTDKAIQIEGNCNKGIDIILGVCEIDKSLRNYIEIVRSDVDDNISKMFDFVLNSWSHHGSAVLSSIQRKKSIVVYDRQYVDPKALIAMIFMSGAIVFFDLQSTIKNPEEYLLLQSMCTDDNIEFYSDVIFEDVDEIKEFLANHSRVFEDGIICEHNADSNIHQIHALILKQELIRLRQKQQCFVANSAKVDALIQSILNLSNDGKGDNENVTEKKE